MLVAITRDLSPRLAEGERTFVERDVIDLTVAKAQHHAYEQWLESKGCAIVKAAPLPDSPDGVFVEDTAVVLDEVAVITRPGAVSRRGETESVETILRRFRKILKLHDGTMDGGDVLRVGRTLFIGQSARTNDRGIAHVRALVQPFGYTVTAVTMRDALHLKTAVTALDDETLIFNPEWVEARAFPSLKTIAIDPTEEFAANVLRVGDTLLIASEYPRTRAILEKHNFLVESVSVSEMMKAEAGVTCCSIVFEE